MGGLPINVYHDEERFKAADQPQRMPALLSTMVCSVFPENQMGISEQQSCSGEIEAMLDDVGSSLVLVPFELHVRQYKRIYTFEKIQEQSLAPFRLPSRWNNVAEQSNPSRIACSKEALSSAWRLLDLLLASV